MIKNAVLASRFLNQPLALHPAHSALLFDMVRSGAEAFVPVDDTERSGRSAHFDVVNGVAVIEIRGVLLHDNDWFWWGASTGYDTIEQAVRAAVEDTSIKAIALLVDSPGGEVAGCFDLVDALFAMRGTKPIHAIVDEACYSAAYALASAADKIWMPRTGGVGSIGVIQQCTSIAGALEKAGIEVTTLIYGEQKADAVPELKMSGAAIQRLQADVNTLGRLFIDTVARNRNIAASKIRSMEAGTFLGSAGVTAGLADGVSSSTNAFLALQNRVASKPTRMVRR